MFAGPMTKLESKYFVYVVECQDGSLYTGIAKDVERRVQQHNEGKGARYTRGRGPVVLLGTRGPMAWGDALRLEREIKARPRADKLDFLRSGLATPQNRP